MPVSVHPGRLTQPQGRALQTGHFVCSPGDSHAADHGETQPAEKQLALVVVPVPLGVAVEAADMCSPVTPERGPD